MPPRRAETVLRTFRLATCGEVGSGDSTAAPPRGRCAAALRPCRQRKCVTARSVKPPSGRGNDDAAGGVRSCGGESASGFGTAAWEAPPTMAEDIGRMLLVFGLAIAVIGGLVLLAGRFGIGRLPGDLAWKGDDWAVYVPLGWMIVVSVVLTLLLNLLSGGE